MRRIQIFESQGPFVVLPEENGPLPSVPNRNIDGIQVNLIASDQGWRKDEQNQCRPFQSLHGTAPVLSSPREYTRGLVNFRRIPYTLPSGFLELHI